MPDLVPLPSVAAHAVASVLLDVPSGRLAGVWVVDNSEGGGGLSPAGQLPPSCVAFPTDPSSAVGAPPLLALFIQGHHFNDRTVASLTLDEPAVRVVSGLGAELGGGGEAVGGVRISAAAICGASGGGGPRSGLQGVDVGVRE